jgi:manganese transport protein
MKPAVRETRPNIESELTPLQLLLSRGRMRSTFSMLGPAFVAAIAYVDPGNFATNFQGGAEFGYLLLWVVLAANLMAMLIQYLSAKLGIVTDRNLPELCRDHYARPVAWALWLQAELMAMATDIAEFLGAALGLNLLFHVPLLIAGAMTGCIVFGTLALQNHGYRRFELTIWALLGLIFLGFAYETFKVGPSASATLDGLVPHLRGTRSLYLAVGIIGATVMPHVIYLHSALTKSRVPLHGPAERQRVLRFERADVLIALGLAGLVNMAMLAEAAKLFYATGQTHVATLQQVHSGIADAVGGAAALAFAATLLASGVSASSVGTYAGQVVMAGFVNMRIPLTVRRVVTMIPALVILLLGVSPTSTLVLSQVVLSFGIPFALVPLVLLTSRKDVMGVHVNRALTTWVAWATTGAITLLNVLLLYRQI